MIRRGNLTWLHTSLNIDDYYNNFHLFEPPAFEGMNVIPVPMSSVLWRWSGSVSTPHVTLPKVFAGQTEVVSTDTAPHINEVQWQDKWVNE